MKTSGWRAGLIATVVTTGVPERTWAQAAMGSASRPSARLDDDPVTPRMMALGGRAEAASSSTSAMFGNPAMLTAARVYHVDAYGLYAPTLSRFSFGSAVVDSTRAVAAGLSYVYNHVDSSTDHRSGHDLRFDIALPLGTSVGIGGRVRYLNVSAGPPVFDNHSSLNARAWDGFLFDAGIYVRPASFLTLSASGRNLNNPNTTAAPFGVGLGAAVTPFSVLTLVADVLLDLRTVGVTRGCYSGGAEIFLGNHYALRAGYLFDDIRGGAQAITGGLGYLDEHFGIEVAMRQGFTPVAETTLMLSMRYFYQSN
jgi:hypothetical protein